MADINKTYTSNTLYNDSTGVIAFTEQLKQELINWANYHHVTEELGPDNRPDTQNALNNLFLSVYERFLTFLNDADATEEAINTWKEIENFLADYTDEKTLAEIVAELNANIESRLTVPLESTTGSSTTSTMTQKAITETIDASSTFTTGEKVENVGIDDEPTAGSDNLVKSGGVTYSINQLYNQTVDLNKNISNNIRNLVEFSDVSGIDVSGLIPNKTTMKFTSSSSTNYGIMYIPVSGGKVYHIVHSEKTWYSSYVAAGFCKNVPNDNVKIDTPLKLFNTETTTELDLLYCPQDDGYLFVFYTTGASYYFKQESTLKDFYTKTESDSNYSKLVYRRDRVKLNIGLSEAKRLFDTQNCALSSSIGTSINSDGLITITENQSADYGINYLSVTAGKTYAIKSSNKTSLPGYLNVSFSKNMLSNGSYVDCRIFIHSSATESFDFLYTPIADGYLYLSYYNGETSKWSVSEVLSSMTIPVSEETKELQGMIKTTDVLFSMSGYGRIGSIYYRGNLGANYSMSPITPIDNYKTLIVNTKGNGSISCICFFNENKTLITDLNVVGSSTLTRYVKDLSDAQYANVKYIQVGGYDANADFSEMYAYLIPKYNLDSILPIKYRKILCIGDSLTNSVEYTGQKRWVEYVQEMLSIHSRSMAGGAGANMANVGDNTIYSRVQNLTTDSNVDIITLWGGTNDWGSNVTIGDFDTQIVDSTRDVTTFYGGLIANVVKLLTLYPSKRIILIGTTPRTWNSGNSDYNNTPNNGGKYLREYVDAVKKVAEWFGLPFLDLLRTSGINSNNISQYMYQQTNSGTYYYLHFNDYGELQIGNRIGSFIKAVG